AEDGIRDRNVTGVQTCALPILVACSFTRAVVRLDTGAEIAVAPGAELEVLEPVSDGPRDATPRGQAANVVGAAEAGAVSGPITRSEERRGGKEGKRGS